MLIKTRNRTLAVNHATIQHSVVIIFAELLCVFRQQKGTNTHIKELQDRVALFIAHRPVVNK